MTRDLAAIVVAALTSAAAVGVVVAFWIEATLERQEVAVCLSLAEAGRLLGLE